MEKITRRKEPLPVFGPLKDEWKTVPEPHALEVMEAYVNPVRRAILRLLALGPMRKSELAAYVSRLGKKYSRSLVQYHLKQLKESGLVGYMADPEVSKTPVLVYRSARIQVQIKPEPVPKRGLRIPEELIEMELAKVNKGE